MAKAFSDSEKAIIKEKLIESGTKHMLRFGIRKTTVDELTKGVGISKGAFYLFYDSKEELFFDVFMKMDRELHEKIYSMLENIDGKPTIDEIVELCMKTLGFIKPWKNFYTSDELSYLIQKLPHFNRLHLEQDNEFLNKIIEITKNKIDLSEDLDLKIVTTAFKNIMMSVFHSEMTGSDVFEEATRMLLKGLALQILK